jgi:hypothetical protein
MIDPKRLGLFQPQPMGGLFSQSRALRGGLFGVAPAMLGPPNHAWGMGINQWQNIIAKAARRNFQHLPTTIATAGYEPPQRRNRNPLREAGGGEHGGGKGGAGAGRGSGGGNTDRPALRQADMMAPTPDYGFGSPYNETDLFAAAPGGNLDNPPGTFTPLDDVLLDSLDPANAQPYLGGAAPLMTSPNLAAPANPHPAASQPPPPASGEGLPTVEPPAQLAPDEIAMQAGFGFTGLPTLSPGAFFDRFGAPPAAVPGFNGGKAIGTLLGGLAGGTMLGPIGGLAGGLAGRVLGDRFAAPRPASLPRVIVDQFGRLIGVSDGDDGFGGSAYGGGGNDAFGFSGGMPGVGHYSGPNPGPNDPDYGYA